MATPQFDGLPALEGEITSIKILDTDGNPNRVIDDENPFYVDVEWWVFPPASARDLDGTWEIKLFGESIGPGPEPRVAAETEKADGRARPNSYKHRFVVSPPNYGGLKSNDTPPPDSGVYRLLVTLTYRNTLGVRTEMAGFFEGPLIMLREP